MHLVKLTFWQNSKLQFMLVNRTFICKLTSSDMFHHDFRNCLVLLKPCTSQCTGFNWEALMLIYLKLVIFKLSYPLRVKITQSSQPNSTWHTPKPSLGSRLPTQSVGSLVTMTTHKLLVYKFYHDMIFVKRISARLWIEDLFPQTTYVCTYVRGGSCSRMPGGMSLRHIGIGHMGATQSDTFRYPRLR